MRLLIVFGTRPEIIKLAPVIKELGSRPAFEIYVCHTGQHEELAEQAMTTFDIVPDYWLETNQHGLIPTFARILIELDVVMRERWDLVMVQGDTSSALAGALSAFYHKIPVAHVEAGLRTYDKTQPWPEEVNRRLITQIADWHFCPTRGVEVNIAFELRIPYRPPYVVGNTVIDALLWVKQRYGLDEEVRVGHILVTAHRRENWGEGIENICKAVRKLLRHDELRFVWAVHPNRIVKDTVERELGYQEHMVLREPLSYQDLVAEMMKAQIILTDSGGIQEEAPTLNTPVLVLRDKTERPEAIECGAAKLVGTDPDRIVAEVTRLLTDKEEYERMASAKNPFGDGHAAERIADALDGH